MQGEDPKLGQILVVSHQGLFWYLELKHKSVCNNWTCGCAIAAAEVEGDLVRPSVGEYFPIVTFQRVPWGPAGLWAGVDVLPAPL